MEHEMSIMITTLTNMEKIHGVIGIGQTENAIPFLVKRVLIATTTGSVKKGFVKLKSGFLTLNNIVHATLFDRNQ